MFAVVSGFTRQPTARLRRPGLWGVSPAYLAKFDQLKEITSRTRNYRTYKILFRKSRGKPQIPHLAVLCQEIFSLEDLSDTIDSETNNVNFGKFWQEWQILDEYVLQCQERSSLFSDTLMITL